MNTEKSVFGSKKSPIHIIATLFGITVGFAGIEHGFFEVLQGNKIPEGLINSGFYVLEPSVLSRIPEGFSDFGKDILPQIAKEGRLFCAEHKGHIFDIGTIEDLRRAEEYLRLRQD